MLRAIALFAFLATQVLWFTIPARLLADGDAGEKKQKQIAEQARKFEYAGAQIGNYNNGRAYQSVVSTPDGLDAVDAWYRKKLEIQPGEGTGVSSRTTLVGQDTPKERGYEVRRSLYVNEQKLKEDDPREKVPQTATVRTYIVKEETYTLVIVATRSKEDKATQISVTLIPDSTE